MNIDRAARARKRPTASSPVRKIPEFRPGDTLRVNVKIKEGERERVQAYEGVCIARAGHGHRRELHRPQDLLRRRRGAGVPDPVAE